SAYCFFCVLFFFFQAEDGIRDQIVTGVQTCALPIFWGGPRRVYATVKFVLYTLVGSLLMLVAILYLYLHSAPSGGPLTFDLDRRSEERRVGKECRSRGAPDD